MPITAANPFKWRHYPGALLSKTGQGRGYRLLKAKLLGFENRGGRIKVCVYPVVPGPSHVSSRVSCSGFRISGGVSNGLSSQFRKSR